MNVARSLLDGKRDHLLTKTRAELMKQEQKVESVDNCISELQQQQRLELQDAHDGYVESSRREQVRPQEEFVVKEKALCKHNTSNDPFSR